MEIKQLKALIAIVETGSFGEAASRLRLTQSAISHQIRHLEDELGETLLIRGKPHVVASASGRAVLASAYVVLAEVSGIKNLFATADPYSLAGEITVAATSVGMTYLYGDLCEGFMRRFPKVELIFRSADTAEEATRSVAKGAADVGFVPFVHEHPTLQRVPLGRTEDTVIVGRNHPLSKRKTVSVEEILQWPFVRFHPGSGSRSLSAAITAKSSAGEMCGAPSSWTMPMPCRAAASTTLPSPLPNSIKWSPAFRPASCRAAAVCGPSVGKYGAPTSSTPPKLTSSTAPASSSQIIR